ncbi:S-adenosyl-L-homocysteine hydrolase [Novosphingobium kaempferiae]|uniref:S-adenosyl-L-homocysteine hydrolase n=1 Tax=Novosphingobium kaempferiae TaxID=2896849 RepID=UPI001E37B467|nr:S-adenosyl-L-homocysteine hydrolase [Novosphingobium kaempferiae]
MATPSLAAEGDAQKLRRMDIMLMVTGLRCRTTADNFIEDYGRFTSSHMTELNEANAELRGELAEDVGEEGAARALDKMSVVMANEYGGGHPWLSCHELREVTQGLALVQGRETLVEAAGQLLERQPPVLFALARR